MNKTNLSIKITPASLQKFGKKLFWYWLRYQGIWFMLLFVVLCAIALNIWYVWYYDISSNSEQIERLMKEKESVDLNEKLYDQVLVQLQERERMKNAIINSVQDIFRLPSQ